ncbi:MAG: TIM44-like domain-containing protein, partial [Acidobacteriota bacterium]
GGGGVEALVFILLLCLQHPQLLLVLMLGGGLVGLIGYLGSDNDWDSVAPTTATAPVPRPRPALDQIRTIDPNFSAVLFEDFVFRLYATAQTFAGGAGKLDELAPYLSAAARRALTDRQKQRPVTGVVIGQMRVSRINLPGPAEESGDFTAFLKVGIQFEANYSVGSGPGSRRFVVEDWLLRREAGARTKPPGARRFPCPNCGAPWRGDAAAGTQKCSSCGAVVDNGRFDWQVEEINVRRETDRVPGLEADVPEQGTSLPTVVDENFAGAWQSLRQEDPGVDDATTAARLKYIYTTLNDAWSRNHLDTARPVISDGLADYFHYWIDAYESAGLRNVLEDTRLTRHELVRVVRDRHYDALTIRIWATGKDYVVRIDNGTVVRGSRDRDRDYSEYWTLIRSGARRGPSRADNMCGSCGAALTVTMSGECEHCGSHVTAGEFDWVLSKIEQDEAYRG